MSTTFEWTRNFQKANAESYRENLLYIPENTDFLKTNQKFPTYPSIIRHLNFRLSIIRQFCWNVFSEITKKQAISITCQS